MQSCGHPARPAAHPTRPFDLMTGVESQQPGYLSHSEAAAALFGRLRSDKPSSLVIVCSACPTRRSASRTAPSRSPSGVSTATARASSGVPGRRVLCAVPPGHLTLSVAPLASPIPDPSRPYQRRSLSTPVFHSVLCRYDELSGHTDDLDLFRVPPSVSELLMCHTPNAPPEVARVVLTAPAACTPSGGCDDEPPQAHSWLGV
jgi:hypothetical protein